MKLKYDIPSRLTHKSRVDIGLEMIGKLDAENLFDFQWFLGDTLYGARATFRVSIPAGRHYSYEFSLDNNNNTREELG